MGASERAFGNVFWRGEQQVVLIVADRGIDPEHEAVGGVAGAEIGAHGWHRGIECFPDICLAI